MDRESFDFYALLRAVHIPYSIDYNRDGWEVNIYLAGMTLTTQHGDLFYATSAMLKKLALFAARGRDASETPPDTTPTPTPYLAGKESPVDDGRRKGGKGSNPSFRLPDPKPDPEAGQYTRKGG